MQHKILLSTACLVMAAGCAYAEKGYVIRDLGNFGATSASVDAMNDRGQMVVNTFAASTPRAYFIDGSKITPLPMGTRGNGINSYGDVVGSITVSGVEKGFLYRNGALTTLDSVKRANAINDRGQIVGDSGRAVLWQNGSVTQIGPFQCCGWDFYPSSGVAINERGRVAATVLFDWNYPRLWYWEHGVEHNLGFGPKKPEFFDDTTVTAINESGAIAGHSYSTENHPCFVWAFIVENDVFRVMPLPGSVYPGPIAINDAGTIAGTLSLWSMTSCDPYTRPESAFVLQKDGDFTALPALAKGADAHAGAINNRGQVGGSSEGHAVIWERR